MAMFLPLRVCIVEHVPPGRSKTKSQARSSHCQADDDKKLFSNKLFHEAAKTETHKHHNSNITTCVTLKTCSHLLFNGR